MNTRNEYIPIPTNLSLAVRKEHRLIVMRKASAVIFRVTWKTLLYAFLLTIANVII